MYVLEERHPAYTTHPVHICTYVFFISLFFFLFFLFLLCCILLLLHFSKHPRCTRETTLIRRSIVPLFPSRQARNALWIMQRIANGKREGRARRKVGITMYSRRRPSCQTLNIDEKRIVEDDSMERMPRNDTPNLQILPRNFVYRPNLLLEWKILFFPFDLSFSRERERRDVSIKGSARARSRSILPRAKRKSTDSGSTLWWSRRSYQEFRTARPFTFKRSQPDRSKSS